MYEIDGTAYKDKPAYKRCLEKMRNKSKKSIKLILKVRDRAADPGELKLLEEAYMVELQHLAYAHFNLAWLKNPGIMKHYAAEIKSESEGTDNDTTRS